MDLKHKTKTYPDDAILGKKRNFRYSVLAEDFILLVFLNNTNLNMKTQAIFSC